jgi:hypothetical protein
VIDRFVDIGGIVDHHCFKLSFHNKSVGTLSGKSFGKEFNGKLLSNWT